MIDRRILVLPFPDGRWGASIVEDFYTPVTGEINPRYADFSLWEKELEESGNLFDSHRDAMLKALDIYQTQLDNIPFEEWTEDQC